MNNLLDLLYAIAAASATAIGSYVAVFIKRNSNAKTLVEVLPKLAHDAVIAMQALGVDTYLEGQLKKSKAVASVAKSLSKLKINKASTDALFNAVQAAFTDCEQAGKLDDYPQKAAPAVDKAAITEQINQLHQQQVDLAQKEASLQAEVNK